MSARCLQGARSAGWALLLGLCVAWPVGAGTVQDEERAQGAWTSTAGTDTPVVEAARVNDRAALSDLLKQGEDPNQTDSAGITALMLAASGGHLDLVRALVAAGADLEHVDRDSRTALMWAASFGQAGAIDLLCGSGAKLERTGPYGVTALVFAVGGGHEQAVRRLLAAGADASAGYEDGTSAISAAARRGARGIFSALWAAGADPWKPNSGEVNALMAAAAEGHEEIVSRLLADEKRLLDAQTSRGWTVVHYAVVGNHVPVLRQLLAAGAEADRADAIGRTPLAWAEALGNDTLAVLESHAAAQPADTEPEATEVDDSRRP